MDGKELADSIDSILWRHKKERRFRRAYSGHPNDPAAPDPDYCHEETEMERDHRIYGDD